MFLTPGSRAHRARNIVQGLFRAGRLALGGAADPTVNGSIGLPSGAVINWNSSNFTITQTTGKLTFSGIGQYDGQLIGKGTGTNDSAAAGYIGEIISSAVESGSAVSLTNATGADVTSISLTAGDWDVTGIVHLTGGATTTFSNGFACISTTTGTLNNTAANATQIWGNNNTLFAAATYVSFPSVSTRISLSSTTTIFLVTLCAFGVSTCSAFGYIQARRVR